MRGLRLAAVCAAAALSGCIFDHGAQENYREAVRRPTGKVVRLTVDVGSESEPRHIWLYGELLVVADEGLLMATDSALLYVPLERIGRMPDESLEPFEGRYPHGLDDASLDRLLAEMGMTRVDTVGRPARSPEGKAGRARGGAEGGDTDPAPADVEGSDPRVLQAFLAEAAVAAADYSALETAVAAGYRRLGPSFPGMGEHWIHPGLIVTGAIEARRPPVLCYARVGGRPVLVALAYAVPLEAGEAPPVYPAGRHVWHDHTDRVDEETLLLTHPSSHGVGPDDGPRLAMFHAWVGLDNPDGVLSQNNWRLPFLQAGLDLKLLERDGLRASPDAGRALSLYTAGPAYYAELFRAAAGPVPAEAEALDRLLARSEAAARAWVEEVRSGPLTAADLGRLESLWTGLWDNVQGAVPAETFEALAALR
jgi:hypothetical protein